MKNLVRAFVAVLALTGAVASAHTRTSSSASPVLTKQTAIGIPSCPPDDPNACGMGTAGW